jgi:hypothetical protein
LITNPVTPPSSPPSPSFRHSSRLGLCGGWFVDCAEAIRYAMFETGGAPRAVLLAPGVVEPDVSLDDEDRRRARSPSAA